MRDARQPQRHGIADQQTEEGRNRGIDQRGQKGAQVKPVGEDAGVGVETDPRMLTTQRKGRRGRGLGGHAHHDHDEEGQQEEDDEPQVRQTDQKGGPALVVEPALKGGPCHPYATSTSAEAGSNPTKTASSQSATRAPSSPRRALTAWACTMPPPARSIR